jgi:hypothetical protein
MSTGGLFLSVVIFILGALWLAQPILRRKTAYNGTSQAKEREVLLTEYERVLSTIRDLDEDFNIGKLSKAAYDAERSYRTKQGVEILQALEKLGVSKPAEKLKKQAKAQPDADAVLDAAIEQAIASYVSATSGGKGK